MGSLNSLSTKQDTLLSLVREHLDPLALTLKYTELPLESRIAWKPIVLVLGNYSSGKSTLINEVIGSNIQETGQAPTDDCFTVITTKNSQDHFALEKGETTKDGYFLVQKEEFPFGAMKKYGDKFLSHFKVKFIESTNIEDFALIDTPGMLDSIAEKDRGYDYQAVIGELASLADLILVLFDPHKAGTVQESYASLRYTLPHNTLENRVIFVLNRVDECENLKDLLKVYGTLCWNLSQMLGRKDIPRILMSYSGQSQKERSSPLLQMLENQRQELKNSIFNVPESHVENMNTFVEVHSFRLFHLVETLKNVFTIQRKKIVKLSFFGLCFSFFVASVSALFFHYGEGLSERMSEVSIAIGTGVFFITYGFWLFFVFKFALPRIKENLFVHLKSYAKLSTQELADSWLVIESLAQQLIKDESKTLTLRQLNGFCKELKKVYLRAKEMRNA